MNSTEDARIKAKKSGQSGFILVVVIWSLALMAVLVLSFASTARVHSQSVRNLVANGEAEAIADAGVHLAIAKLLDVSVAGLNGTARLPSKQRQWVCKIEGHGNLWITVEDEGGKIDLNTASDELLVALFRSYGNSQPQAWKLVDAVVDFRDADDLPRANGAEAADYASAKKAYGPSNRLFESVEELDQVLGMNRDLFDRIRNVTTVYSRQQGLDPEVTEVVFLKKIARAASAVGEASEVASLRPEFVTPSNAQAFTIKVTARLERGGVFARRAIVQISADPSKPYAVRDWRRDDEYLRPEPGIRNAPPC